MPITILDLQKPTPAHQTVPRLAPTEATTLHQVTPSAALTQENKKHVDLNFPPNKNSKGKNGPLNFCPTCKTLLRSIESNPSSLRCKKCGYKADLGSEVILGRTQRPQSVNEIAVIDKEKLNLRTHTVVKAICENCGKNESETWAIAVGSEGTVSAFTFLRCINCGYTRREVG